MIVEAGEDAERLQVAWKKISKQDVVHYKGHGSSKGRERVRVSVERTQPKFPRAAAEALSQETGMFASAR